MYLGTYKYFIMYSMRMLQWAIKNKSLKPIILGMMTVDGIKVENSVWLSYNNNNNNNGFLEFFSPP